MAFAVSAPEGLHRYLYRVPVPSCRQFDAWVAKEYPLSAAAQRLSRSNLRLDLQQLLTLLFQQRRWLGQARYPASSGNARNLPTASVACHGYQGSDWVAWIRLVYLPGRHGCRTHHEPPCPAWPSRLPRLRTSPSCANFASSAFSHFFMVSRSGRSQMQRTPKGDTSVPRFF